MKFTLFKKIRAACTPQKTKKRRSRPRTIYEDHSEEYATDGRDHTHDDEMGGFEYWHRRIMRFNPNIFGGAMDGKRETMSLRHDYIRRKTSYERRRSERRAAKEAARAAKESQEECEKRWSNPDAIDPKPKRKVADLLLSRRQSHQATPTQAEMFKTKTMSYELQEDQKLDVGRWDGPERLNVTEDIGASHDDPAAPTRYHDADDGCGFKRWNELSK